MRRYLPLLMCRTLNTLSVVFSVFFFVLLNFKKLFIIKDDFLGRRRDATGNPGDLKAKDTNKDLFS